jgi:hypothetical protein
LFSVSGVKLAVSRWCRHAAAIGEIIRLKRRFGKRFHNGRDDDA